MDIIESLNDLSYFQVQCRDIIDKYTEYDPVIISLDVLLLKREALRHVLYNSNVQVTLYFKYRTGDQLLIDKISADFHIKVDTM